jgi:hypothetical protein
MRPPNTPPAKASCPRTASPLTKFALSVAIGGTVLVGLAVGSASANPLGEIVHHVPFLETVVGGNNDTPSEPPAAGPEETSSLPESTVPATTVHTTEEPASTSAPTTPTPTMPVGEESAPVTSKPEDEVEAATTVLTVPTNAPAPSEEKKVPTVVAMQCSATTEPRAITCTWAGAIPEGAATLRLGRGESTNRGRVVWQSTDPASTTAVDAGPLATPAPYLLMIFAADGTYLGHSNPVQI